MIDKNLPRPYPLTRLRIFNYHAQSYESLQIRRIQSWQCIEESTPILRPIISNNYWTLLAPWITACMIIWAILRRRRMINWVRLKKRLFHYYKKKPRAQIMTMDWDMTWIRCLERNLGANFTTLSPISRRFTGPSRQLVSKAKNWTVSSSSNIRNLLKISWETLQTNWDKSCLNILRYTKMGSYNDKKSTDAS